MTSYRQIWWHFKDWKFHPRLCPYFHVSVDVVETTVGSGYTESRVPETTPGVVPELTTARAIEGNSRSTHGLMDKMTATSQKTFLNAFPPMEVLLCNSNFTEVWSMAWRLFCKGNTLVTDEFRSHRASSAETCGILLHRHILTRGKMAATSSQMVNFSPSNMVLISTFMSLRILFFYGFYIVHVA